MFELGLGLLVGFWVVLDLGLLLCLWVFGGCF